MGTDPDRHCGGGRGLAARIAARIPVLWPLKAFGTTAFMFLFFAGYLQLLENPLFPVSVMPLTVLDEWIGFQPAALLPYASLWFYVSLPPALIESRRELIHYGWAVGGLCLLGMACFLFWPTAVPPAAVDWQLYPGYDLLKGVDAAGNACPSLHVATAVFSGLWLDRQLRELGGGRLSRLINGIWCLGIVWSTLATKQHVALDVAGGLVLGLAGGYLSLARARLGETARLAPRLP